MAETKRIYGMTIPTDNDGFVPEKALQKRYKQFYDKKQREYDINRDMGKIDGTRSMPNINLARRDYSNTSDEVIPLRCTPQQVAAWWHDPTSMDVQDIDAPGAPKVNLPSGMTPQQKRDQGKIKVVATPAEEAKVRRTLVMTYDQGDVHKFAQARPIIAVAPEPVGRKGAYYPSRTRVELDRYGGLDQGTLAHEGAHHLRATDHTRSDILLKVNSDRCIEESCTVAEQMARSDSPDYTGYYADVAVYDQTKHAWRRPKLSEAKRMAEEDHLLFTEGRGRGLKGQDATSSVKRHWTESHISRLRIGGNMMAVNLMAEKHGNVDRVSMAKAKTQKAEANPVKITNATAGRPGVTAAKQTKLFLRR